MNDVVDVLRNICKKLQAFIETYEDKYQDVRALRELLERLEELQKAKDVNRLKELSKISKELYNFVHTYEKSFINVEDVYSCLDDLRELKRLHALIASQSKIPELKKNNQSFDSKKKQSILEKFDNKFKGIHENIYSADDVETAKKWIRKGISIVRFIRGISEFYKYDFNSSPPSLPRKIKKDSDLLLTQEFDCYYELYTRLLLLHHLKKHQCFSMSFDALESIPLKEREIICDEEYSFSEFNFSMLMSIKKINDIYLNWDGFSKYFSFLKELSPEKLEYFLNQMTDNIRSKDYSKRFFLLQANIRHNLNLDNDSLIKLSSLTDSFIEHILSDSDKIKYFFACFYQEETLSLSPYLNKYKGSISIDVLIVLKCFIEYEKENKYTPFDFHYFMKNMDVFIAFIKQLAYFQNKGESISKLIENLLDPKQFENTPHFFEKQKIHTFLLGLKKEYPLEKITMLFEKMLNSHSFVEQATTRSYDLYEFLLQREQLQNFFKKYSNASLLERYFLDLFVGAFHDFFTHQKWGGALLFSERVSKGIYNKKEASILRDQILKLDFLSKNGKKQWRNLALLLGYQNEVFPLSALECKEKFLSDLMDIEKQKELRKIIRSYMKAAFQDISLFLKKGKSSEIEKLKNDFLKEESEIKLSREASFKSDSSVKNIQEDILILKSNYECELGENSQKIFQSFEEMERDKFYIFLNKNLFLMKEEHQLSMIHLSFKEKPINHHQDEALFQVLEDYRKLANGLWLRERLKVHGKFLTREEVMAFDEDTQSALAQYFLYGFYGDANEDDLPFKYFNLPMLKHVLKLSSVLNLFPLKKHLSEKDWALFSNMSEEELTQFLDLFHQHSFDSQYLNFNLIQQVLSLKIFPNAYLLNETYKNLFQCFPLIVEDFGIISSMRRACISALNNAQESKDENKISLLQNNIYQVILKYLPQCIELPYRDSMFQFIANIVVSKPNTYHEILEVVFLSPYLRSKQLFMGMPEVALLCHGFSKDELVTIFCDKSGKLSAHAEAVLSPEGMMCRKYADYKMQYEWPVEILSLLQFSMIQNQSKLPAKRLEVYLRPEIRALYQEGFFDKDYVNALEVEELQLIANSYALLKEHGISSVWDEKYQKFMSQQKLPEVAQNRNRFMQNQPSKGGCYQVLQNNCS